MPRAFPWHRRPPLEEALANAYAYNSLSFISRVKTGYRHALVWHYQRALIPQWRFEGPGCFEAGSYIEGHQVVDNAQLLTMLLGRPEHPRLEQVAAAVMPSGFSAFVGKPDIPTWVVGSPGAVKAFHDMEPAPNDTNCHQFWSLDDSKASAALQQRQKEIDEQKGKAKGAAPQS
jgi:hypothetical protein